MKKQKFKTLEFSAFLLAAIILHTSAAYAQCIAGVPCVINSTPNDPFDPSDGPNASGAPNASKSDSGACDADFMNQIYAQAFMEARRENITNEIVIRKPDSVLEYTCFDQIVSATAVYAGPLFTESTRWQGIDVPIDGAINGSPVDTVPVDVFMGDDKLDTSLENLVLASLSTYVNSNFAHDFLGGYMSGADNSISNSVGDGSYTCSFMDEIYYFAKCNDIVTDDVFFRFSNLVNFQGDPRALPTACSGINLDQGILDLANNNDFQHVNFDTVNPTYLDRLTASPCSDPVPTGISVEKQIKEVDLSGNVQIIDTITYEEKTCSNPGCYYAPPPNDQCVQ